MAPPSHTDKVKEAAMRSLASTYLSKNRIQDAGLLDPDAVQTILERHGNEATPVAERVQLDAVINHMLSVQILHNHFVANDVTQQAQADAKRYGWSARDLSAA